MNQGVDMLTNSSMLHNGTPKHIVFGIFIPFDNMTYNLGLSHFWVILKQLILLILMSVLGFSNVGIFENINLLF